MKLAELRDALQRIKNGVEDEASAYCFMPFGCILLAIAADWKLIGIGDDGSIMYADRESAKGAQGKGQVWVRYDFSKVRSERAREMKQLFEIDCDQRTLTSISSIRYLPDGSILSKSNVPEFLRSPEPVIPETLGDDLLKKICAT